MSETLDDNDDMCVRAYSYRSFLKMNLLQYVQIILAVSSIFMVYLLVRTSEFKRLSSIVRPSLKIVASLGILTYILGSLFSFVCYAYIVAINWLNLSPCQYVWSTASCWRFRLPMYYCLVGYNTFHMSLLLERFFSTFCGERSQDETESGFSRLTGILLSIFMVVIPFVITYWVFGNEDLNSKRTYCLAGSVSASERIVVFTNCLFYLDLVALMGDCLLLIYNKRQLKRRVDNYNLQRSYQLKEQQITIYRIFPLTLIHSVSFLVYLLFFVQNRAYLNNGNLDEKQKFLYGEINSLAKAVYIAVVPLGLLLYSRLRGKEQWLKKQENPNPADVYFQMFQRQIA